MEVATPSFAALGFQTLSPLLSYSPGDGTPTAAPSPPSDAGHYDLLMIWGWMNAAPRHVIKYVQLHRTLQPGVPVVFMQSTAASWLGWTGAFDTSLPMIFDIVKTLPEKPKIFVHTFSNGGTTGFAKFLALYQNKTGNPLSVRTLLIDSAPGGLRMPSALTRGVNAFMEMVRNPILKRIVYPVMYLFMSILYLPPMLMGIEHPIGAMRRTLNDETLISEGDTRGYTFCKGDTMVGWEEIVEHAEEAEGRGWRVFTKGFDGGSHVGGYRHHPQEYEDFIKQLKKATPV
ncbi:hypothetical protein H072_5638 [Dactylellina haptotyla CBS 200.50]|uniref:Indole-diterpene biosynthesis protein PaxU n=1 Tax=Dactylellina haptotyla (strain CBS 200.50) TaxID=1284197 RepID=S8AH61_DACHA|nr:hypothetical protein H072_5638 [Dactylellina haptotyla CBS 200.50]